MTYKNLQWLVPAFALLHNAEEAMTMRAYAPLVRERFADAAPPGLLAATAHLPWFYSALIVVTVVPTLVVLASVLRPGRITAWAVVFVQSIFLVNVFVPHVPAAFALGGYTPGVVTAICIELPFSIYILRRSISEGVVSMTGAATAVLSALLALLLMLGALYSIVAGSNS